MKRPVNEVIAMLSALPPDAKIDVISTWSNGRKVRQYRGQDGWDRSAGFRKKSAILIPEVSADDDESAA